MMLATNGLMLVLQSVLLDGTTGQLYTSLSRTTAVSGLKLLSQG